MSKVRKILDATVRSFLVALGLLYCSTAIAQILHDEFASWSNSIPEEQALEQIGLYLNAARDVAGIEALLSDWGFDVEKPVAINVHTAEILGIAGDNPVSIVANWNTTADGVIFAHGILRNLEARVFVRGVTLEIVVTENAEVQTINLTRTRE